MQKISNRCWIVRGSFTIEPKSLLVLGGKTKDGIEREREFCNKHHKPKTRGHVRKTTISFL